MSIVLYDSATVAAAGTSGTPSDATQLTRLGAISSFIITNLIPLSASAGTSGFQQGVLLPTSPQEGDLVEMYAEAENETENGKFILYSDVNQTPWALTFPNAVERITCRYTGSTYGWYVVG
jgi:hypothetical protein